MSYTGTVEWSEQDNLFFGKVKDIRSHILYEGKTIDELRDDFYDAIDLWLSKGCKLWQQLYLLIFKH